MVLLFSMEVINAQEAAERYLSWIGQGSSQCCIALLVAARGSGPMALSSIQKARCTALQTEATHRAVNAIRKLTSNPVSDAGFQHV